MYTQDEQNLIILSSITELTYNTRFMLLADNTSAPFDLENHKNLLIKTLSDGVYNKVRDKFYDGAYRAKILGRLAEKGIRCVTYFSDGYPVQLKNIDAPPFVLYCKGDVSLLKTNCFSVVGSRMSTAQALAGCKKISGEIASAFTVVSGIADGADTAALQGAMAAGGKVISVLACGLERAYAGSNARLAQKIADEGLLISEYLPDAPALRHHFPFRNRIIAGLSRGTLVVSAGVKSGALITANYALEYGRDVFAIPYSPNIASGRGCNYLIKNGAYLTENILDIFNAYGLDFNTRSQKILSAAEREVYEAVRNSGEAFLPAISERLGKLPHEITPVMLSLTLKSLVVNLGGNRYAAIENSCVK